MGKKRQPSRRELHVMSLVFLLLGLIAPAPLNLLSNMMEAQYVRYLIFVALTIIALRYSGISISVISKGRKLLVVAAVIVAVGNAFFLWSLNQSGGLTFAEVPSIIYFSAFILFGVGLCEEFLFRGGIQTVLGAEIGKRRGWIVASVIFAAFHLPEYWGPPLFTSVAVSIVFLLGLGAGYLYLRTGNLLLSISLHSSFDMFGWMRIVDAGLSPPPPDLNDMAIVTALIILIVLALSLRDFSPRRRNSIQTTVSLDAQRTIHVTRTTSLSAR
ncbi:MAG: CPBP family intramembrane metalloprotease [Nitrososphaerota archaeon]|nr:CPBP family intramembrane metalloprotease [Nitrososphaerota archaeon]MDG6949368.1 CPBP family intramembrane metalloprotease [Nitrososphaerota archaeon]